MLSARRAGGKKMTPTQFIEKILKLPIEKQAMFFETLKKELSEEDYETTVKFIIIYSMFKSEAKYEAIKTAVCDALCEDFYGHTVEKKKKTEDPCNPIYMMSIL